MEPPALGSNEYVIPGSVSLPIRAGVGAGSPLELSITRRGKKSILTRGCMKPQTVDGTGAHAAGRIGEGNPLWASVRDRAGGSARAARVK